MFIEDPNTLSAESKLLIQNEIRFFERKYPAVRDLRLTVRSTENKSEFHFHIVGMYHNCYFSEFGADKNPLYAFLESFLAFKLQIDRMDEFKLSVAP